MFLQSDIEQTLSRRAFLARSTTGLGAIALGSLLRRDLFGAEAAINPSPKAKG
ncbi:MAG: sulfatase, partial [Verrucomicrobia bacterium]